jgi:hypothetical protein
VFVNHILASVNHIRAFETYILAFVNYILPSFFTNQTQKPTAKEKAHLQTAEPAPKATSAKELFPSPFSPPPKKEKISLLSNPKNQPCRIDGTAYNKSFARLRGKVLNSSLLPIFEHWYLIESFGIFSPQPRKAPIRYRLF